MSWNRLWLALATVLLVSCSDDPVATENVDGYPSRNGIFHYLEEDSYRFVEIPRSRGVVALRGRSDVSYPLKDVPQDKDCYFGVFRFVSRVQGERWIRLHNENLYWQTADQGAGGEVFLSFLERSQPELDDESCMFILHNFDAVDGKANVAIESVAHRGKYMTAEGNILAGNGITFKAFSSADKAPRWMIFHSSLYPITGTE